MKWHNRHAALLVYWLLVISTTFAQVETRAALPAVIAAATPIYPIGPHTANIQGVVRIRVATDGHRVADASVEDDGKNPALGRAALENAKTWEFANHKPTGFTVTYRYVLVEKLPDIKSAVLNSKVISRFPTDLEIYAQRWPGTVNVPAQVK